MKKVVEFKGVKINLTKGTLKLPKKALSKLKKCVKKVRQDGTYVLNENVTYHRIGHKELCYRNAYISNDYLILPLSTDIFNLTSTEVIDNNSVNEQVLLENTNNFVEVHNEEDNSISKDDYNLTFNFTLGNEIEIKDIPENAYFLYNNEVYIRGKYGKSYSNRRLPDLTPISYVLNDVDKREVGSIKVQELILNK